MSLKLDEKEYLLIYNSLSLQDREALGYVQSLKLHVVNQRDVSKDMLTETQLAEAAQKLGVHISELFQSDTDQQLDDEELLKILKKNPSLLKTPFILSAKRSFFVRSPLNLIKEQFVNN